MVRAQINLITQQDAANFVNCLDEDNYFLVDSNGTKCVAAKSQLGLIYAMLDFDKMYLVNDTHDGHFPATIDGYRA